MGKYSARKAKMDADPDYRDRVLQSQVESRRRRREREHQEAVAIGGACPHVFANGRRCWKSHPHRHNGIEVDPMAAEVNS